MTDSTSEIEEAAFERAEQPGGRPSARHGILRVRDGASSPASDLLATEEPLEIRLGGKQVAVTMRTPVPGQDIELGLGFLHGEGIVSPEDVAGGSECRAPGGDGGIVDVALRSGATPADGWQRSFYATSSCGICGKASIDAVRLAAPPVPDGPVITAVTLAALPDRLRAAQRVFERTGGLHAAALFDADGAMVILREDVGRHNAVDKLVGRAMMDGLLPLNHHVLMVSGRSSFEIMQKALLAGVPIVAAVSAPSSLAARLASESNMTLVGFLRPGGFNLYSGRERIQTV
jgi:FdhD protein